MNTNDSSYGEILDYYYIFPWDGALCLRYRTGISPAPPSLNIRNYDGMMRFATGVKWSSLEATSPSTSTKIALSVTASLLNPLEFVINQLRETYDWVEIKYKKPIL